MTDPDIYFGNTVIKEDSLSREEPFEVEETEHGYLVLADISGYTPYLATVELVHARDILTDLVGLILRHLKQGLIIAELEGDAVFAYAPATKIIREETLLEILESTYLAFRDRREGILRQTICPCKACRAIPGLDLKFIVHYGEYVLQSVTGIRKPVGSDVNLVHRLLKNHVSETTGWTAYILLTGTALRQAHIQPEGLNEQVESYDHLGQVQTYSLDLHARYKELTEVRRVLIAPEAADMVLSYAVCAPPVVVWEWMNDIQKRLLWESYDDIRPHIRPGGRTGAGARNHCMHGRNVVPETILDWRPFEYYTVEYPLAIQSRLLRPAPKDTRLEVRIRLKMPLPAWMRRQVARYMVRRFKVEEEFEAMVRMAEEEVAHDPSRGDNDGSKGAGFAGDRPAGG